MGCCMSTASPEIGYPSHHEPPSLGQGLPQQQSINNADSGSLGNLGNTFVNQYLIIKDIGHGSFGKVKLCLNVDDNSLYALKVVSKKLMRRRLLAGKRNSKQTVDEDLLGEISVMKSLDHPNIVKLYEVIDDPEDDKLIMVMEYVEGGEVLSEERLSSPNAKGISEDIARMHFRDLIKGLDYLHYQNVIHRDIKTENLLLTSEGSVKLSDFGTACRFPPGNDLMVDTCGTRTFFAPEMVREGPYSGKKADIYAAGVVLYVLIFNRLPFVDPDPSVLYEKILSEEPDYSGRPDVSPDLIDLLKGLLDKNPEKRLVLEEIMLHEWFTNRRRLHTIKTSKVLSVPTIDLSVARKNTVLTPSIDTVFQQIPDKKVKFFKRGIYIVREGEQMTGFYLIKKGLCIVTEGGLSTIGSSDDGDTDFQEDETPKGTPQTPATIGPEGRKLLETLSAPSAELSEDAVLELSRFKSLDRYEVMRGVNKRNTYQHAKLKELVELAAAGRSDEGGTDAAETSGKSRRGPGSVIGLDLAIENQVSRKNVIVVEPVEAIFVRKESLDRVFNDEDRQLQLRLLVAKLQRIELLTDTVHKLADLHSDFMHMEQLRSLVRNTTFHPPVLSPQ